MELECVGPLDFIDLRSCCFLPLKSSQKLTQRPSRVDFFLRFISVSPIVGSVDPDHVHFAISNRFQSNASTSVNSGPDIVGELAISGFDLQRRTRDICDPFENERVNASDRQMSEKDEKVL
jgi:hypothetical protein